MGRCHGSTHVDVSSWFTLRGFVGDPSWSCSLQACSPDILALCANVSLGGGRVLACLVNHEAKLATAACKPEVFRVAKVTSA